MAATCPSASPPVVAAGNPVSLFPEITAYWRPTVGEVTYEVTPIAVIAGGQVTADQVGSYTVTAGGRHRDHGARCCCCGGWRTGPLDTLVL